jgi:hypothetical protein
MEYIKISRTGPAMYRSVNATGWLCDVYQSFDEQYLGTVWGGGTYVIVAYQNTGGGTREVERGYTQINGNPRAYRGLDGQPVLFPVDAGDGRSGLPGVNAPQQPQQPQQFPQQQFPQQQFPQQPFPQQPFPQQPFPQQQFPQQQFQQQPGMGVQFPSMNNAQPPQTSAPVLDLITLAEKFNGSKQDAKSLEVMQAAQTQNTEFFKATLDRSHDEQRQLRDQLVAMQQHQTAPMQNAIEMYRAQMETRERSHTDTLKQVTAEHLAQLTALRAQQETQVASLRSQQETQVTGLRAQSEKSIEETRRVSEKTSDDNRRAFDAMILSMREESRSREQNVRDAWRVEVDNLRRELENQRLTTATDTTRTRDDARRDLDAARADTDRREQTVREMARTTYEGQLRSLEMQVVTVREQLERRIEDLNNMRNQQDAIQKNSYDMQLQQRDTETIRLRDELVTSRTELVTLRAELGEKRDPMTTLNEVATLTQTFQNITGQNNQVAVAPKDSEPLGWMGQLAKYAPAIGEHLIKPTMKPIAEVVQTVREREEREEALRRDILMRRQALGQRSASQQQQALVQQQQQQQAVAQQQAMTSAQQQSMALRQQQITRQQQLRQQPVARTQPSARPSAAAAPSSTFVAPDESWFERQSAPVTKASESNTATEAPAPTPLITQELVQFLETAVTASTPVDDLVSQITTAVGFGVIDAEMFAQVKSMPVDTLIDEFTKAAGNYGAIQLASPRGEELLRNVHAALRATDY